MGGSEGASEQITPGQDERERRFIKIPLPQAFCQPSHCTTIHFLPLWSFFLAATSTPYPLFELSASCVLPLLTDVPAFLEFLKRPFPLEHPYSWWALPFFFPLSSSLLFFLELSASLSMYITNFRI
jgi:hypothetical protein